MQILLSALGFFLAVLFKLEHCIDEMPILGTELVRELEHFADELNAMVELDQVSDHDIKVKLRALHIEGNVHGQLGERTKSFLRPLEQGPSMRLNKFEPLIELVPISLDFDYDEAQLLHDIVKHDALQLVECGDL